MSDIKEVMDMMEKESKAKRGGQPALNVLKKLFEVNKDKNISEEEMFVQNDLTDVLFNAMKDIIDNREAWNCGVLGGPTTGKSTVMFLLVHFGNEYMKKKGVMYQREDKSVIKEMVARYKKEGTYGQVVGDQIEFMGVTRKGDIWNCFIGIDEYNRLGDTGLNSSIELNLYATYSDIFAQQFVHRVSCSPSVVGDVNCWLLLEVYGTNKKDRTTTCKVVYRDIITGKRMCIGHATFSVGDIIETNEYKRYRKKKFKRMDLLQKHGVRKFSELEWSPIVMDCYEDLKDLAFGDRKVDPDVVISTVEEFGRDKHQFLMSGPLSTEIASKVRGLLSLKHNVEKDNARIFKEEEKEEPNESFIKGLKERRDRIVKKLEKSLGYQKKMIKIYKEYLSIK